MKVYRIIEYEGTERALKAQETYHGIQQQEFRANEDLVIRLLTPSQYMARIGVKGYVDPKEGV